MGEVSSLEIIYQSQELNYYHCTWWNVITEDTHVMEFEPVPSCLANELFITVLPWQNFSLQYKQVCKNRLSTYNIFIGVIILSQ